MFLKSGGFETVLKPGVSILPNLLKAMKLGEGAKSPVSIYCQISKRTCMKKYIKFSGGFSVRNISRQST